jgi:hypothetical protein
MKKRAMSIWVLGGMLALASCQDDTKSEASAAVSITSPQADEKVWLNTPLTAEVATAKAGNKVMFYLDGELLGEDTEAPYELMLDTKQYEDGAYTLRTVAQNGSGEQTEATQTINIFNKLFRVKVGDNYLQNEGWSPKKAWVVVSDTEGNIIQTEELRNSETATVERHERTDEKLIVTLVTAYVEPESYQLVLINSFQGISPDEWFLDGYTSSRSELGTATVDYIVPPGMSTRASASNAYAWTYPTDEGYQASVTIYEEPASLFIANNALDGSAATYALINDVRVDQTTRLEPDAFKSMTLMQNVTFAADDIYFTVDGINESSGERYRTFHYFQDPENPTPSQLSVYHPEGMFDDYAHFVVIEQNEVEYTHRGIGSPKNHYAVPEVSANVIYGANNQTIQISGDYEADFVSGEWEYANYENGVNNTVVEYVYLPASQGDYQMKLQELPSAIVDAYPVLSEFAQYKAYKGVELTDYDSVASLPDYLSRRYGTEEGSYGAWTEIKIKATDAQGGRSQASVPQEVAEKIKQLRRQ